jgi:uncharacterized membrane protein
LPASSYNPQDPSLWVQKRFGIGWTLNFARLASWFLLVALLIPAIAAGLISWLAFHAMHLKK